MEASRANPEPGRRGRPYAKPLVVLAGLLAVAAAAFYQPVRVWLQGEHGYDEAALREWIEEARVFRDTLPEMSRAFLRDLDLHGTVDPDQDPELLLKANAIEEHLRSLGDPPSKMYAGQLPLFPIIYRLALSFDRPAKEEYVIVWDSELPRQGAQYQVLHHDLAPRIHLAVQYQIHAYNRRQRQEQVAARRFQWILMAAAVGALLAAVWLVLVQRQERERRVREARAQTQLEEAREHRQGEELRRRQAEQAQEHTERQLLEQQLATREAERQAWELKTQLFANIGIMAGSYAHNIKNLLLRPNDLLARCMERDGVSSEQAGMLREVRETLATVTQRLQEILRTVHRDPTRSEPVRLNLNQVIVALLHTWQDLAREKWKVKLEANPASEPVWIEADASHLEQALENLLFNARDALAEMRAHLQNQARQDPALGAVERKQALIAAAGWIGDVSLRTYVRNGIGVAEVQDDGIGMSEEVRALCTQPHFSTKRRNALFEGSATGMGLGLSFITAILKNHKATLEIESQPLKGAVFRLCFPLARTESATQNAFSR